MRNFLRYACATVIVLGLPLLTIAAIPKINGYNTTKLHQQLRHQQLYDRLNEDIHARLSNLEPTDGTPVDPESQLSQLMLSQITPAYLQAKTEDVTTQIADWSTGRSTTPPHLSLNDLQEQIMAHSPESQAQLNQLLAELRQAQADQGGQLPQVAEDPESQAALEELFETGTNIQQLADGDWNFSLEGPLAGLPQAYRLYQLSLLLGGIVVILALVGLVLTGQTTQQRLKTVGWTLVIAGIWNGIVAWFFSWVLLDRAFQIIPGLDGPTWGSALLTAVRLAVFDRFDQVQLIITVALIILGLVLYIISRTLRPASPPAAVESAGPSTQAKPSPTGQPKQPAEQPAAA